MPQTQYPKILAFVEGHMEQLFLNNNFRYVEVIQVSNGVGWSVAALCQQIFTFFKARDANADAFIVWIDREKRSESAQEIEDALRLSLISAGAAPDQVHVAVCDQMTENVILADEEFIRLRFGKPDYKYELEGFGGKAALKGLFAGIGVNYRETTHGVACLKSMRLSRCAPTSPPISRLLSTFKLPCWWIDGTVAS